MRPLFERPLRAVSSLRISMRVCTFERMAPQCALPLADEDDGGEDGDECSGLLTATIFARPVSSSAPKTSSAPARPPAVISMLYAGLSR